ncbi:unnamed protein product [Hydatigera taeniaeformis]|uniref:S1 motif domain-containing protein n=1 Tax=Hydatigena taeniaeformis TaxID=6205 RepID=A0A3P7EKG0_HYDTA|nr:unnamed protein product [Hydatigera taeniaeformis]
MFPFKVVSIKEFGAFVSLEGTDRQGLLHRSAISNHPIGTVSDILDIGEKIFVKIISNKDGKLGLSMKVVNQTTGEDKDPNNLTIAETKKRKWGTVRGQSPIRLGAELNTVCKRCGVKGHLAISCFAQTGGEFLGLVASDSDDSEVLSISASQKNEKKRKK